METPEGYTFALTTDSVEYLPEGIIKIAEINMSQATADIKSGETLILTASISPENVYSKNLTWTSSGTNVEIGKQTINEDGTVSVQVNAIESGTTTIVATANDGSGIQGNCTITVTDKLYLYNEGDECTDITGGWLAKPYRINGYNTAMSPSITRNDSNMTFSMSATSSDYYRGVLISSKKVDITGYQTLNIHFISYNCVGDDTVGNVSRLGANLTLTSGDGWTANARGVYPNMIGTDCVIAVDISEVGSGYYFVVIDGLTATASGKITAVIDKIWLDV